jgi:hypothetical protein
MNFEQAAKALAEPRWAKADSFVLHAPLELLARNALLGLIHDDALPLAHERIANIATQYEAFGPAYVPTVRQAPVALKVAFDSGDLDQVDASIIDWCTTRDTPSFLRGLSDVLLDRLSGAGHASIYLNLMQRLTPESEHARFMLRGLARDIARRPGAKVQWINARTATVATNNLLENLLAPESPGSIENNFVIPTMQSIDQTGIAQRLLDSATLGLTIHDARRILLRVAAWSMLQDDPTSAPYGWTHCLTMTQGTLSIAGLTTDPERAIAVAATFVLGFRATQGKVRLDPTWQPDPTHPSARIWNASSTDYDDLVTDMLTAGATHPDAHLAKYVLACYQASLEDPEAGRLFTAAGTYLVNWWSVNDLTH